MIDRDVIYSALQFPMVIMLAAMTVLFAMRARAVVSGDISVPSAAILLCLAGFFAAWAVRLLFWHLRWMLKALDMHDASEAMVAAAVVPLVCNIVSLGFGSAILTIAGRPTLGRLSAPLVIMSVVGLTLAGAALAGAWRG